MVARRFTFVLIVFLTIGSAAAQTNRYMVFFKDKNESPFSISNPIEFLSQKAIDRRTQSSVTITEMDLPVNTSYVNGVRATGADPFFTTRWMNGVLVQCDAELVSSIEDLPYVDHVEMVAPEQRLMSGGRIKRTHRRKEGSWGTETQTQLAMLGIGEMHAGDFRGQGITVAVLDAGFIGVNTTLPFQHIMEEGRFNDSVSYDFVTNSDNVFQFDDHGTEVFSVIAGYVPDSFTGGAFKANFQLYVTEDATSEHRIEEYNWLFAAERADSAGVDVINSSLGYYDFDDESERYTKSQMDGVTAVVTRAAQWAADRGILVVVSAGNEGNISSWGIITAPADAKDVIAVGNVRDTGMLNPSSSRGPTADGRIKPDLVALGTGVKTITGNGTPGSSTGTSLSTPLVTSLAVGVWQAFPELTNKELIEVLKLSASNALHPNNNIGYGIPNYTSILNYLDVVNHLEPAQQARVFDVFPNPVDDTLIVRPLRLGDLANCSLELISSVGQIVMKDEISFSEQNLQHTANLSHLAPGIYFLRVIAEDARYVFRLVKR